MAEPSKTNEATDDLDLEDGEIESDNDEPEVIIVDETIVTHANVTNAPKNLSQNAKNDASMSPNLLQKTRDGTKYHDVKDKGVDDDWMGDVEHAIAMALIKDGIDPPLPKLQVRSNNDNGKKSSEPERQSSKLKKRKRRRLEKDLAKKEELKKKLKLAEEQIDAKPGNDQSDEMLDEYEMLCIRGGSPPPMSQQSVATKISDEPYYSDDSYSSYDSYEERIQKRRAKDRRTGRSKRDNKRRRDDSDDDRHEKRGPRKLELCKFYLMECCAKRDKCLYLHGDFPCKYYYLGMKNHDQDNCKFSHGKPLSDQMRNILLKHLETAPKEILGDFPRLKTEAAHNMLNIQHQKLLKEFGMDVPVMNSNASNNSRIPSLMDMSTMQPKINVDSLQQLQNQHEQYNEQFNKKDSNELSALALSPATKPKLGKARKTRWCDTGPPAISQPQLLQKKLMSHQPSNSNLQKMNSNSGATGNESYLSLKYLNGVITTEQIEKLSSIGIENIDQMNQLTVAQLNELGLSVAQISEIQLNALNMQKLGLAKKPSTASTFSSSQAATVSQNDDVDVAISAIGSDMFYSDFGKGGKDLDMRIPQVGSVVPVASSTSTSCNQDVDMRVLSAQHPSTTLTTALSTKADESKITSPTLTISTIASPDHQPIQSQSNVVTALLPPVPPLTSSPVMSMLSKAQNSANVTNQSMFGDLGSSEKSGIFNDNQQPSIIDYTRFLNKSQIEPQNKVDYSQYLKDSNLDLEKTDLEDLNNDETADDDADETNNLVVIEDEPTLQIDESWCSNDEDTDDDTNHQATNIYDEMDICNEESTNSSPKSSVVKDIQDVRAAKENISGENTSLPISVSLNVLSHPGRFDKRGNIDSSLNTQSPLPAVFDKFSVPSEKIEKINLAKYFTHHDQDNQKTDEDDDDYETMSSGIDDALTDYIVGKDRQDFAIRDPRKNLSTMVEKVTKELQNKQQPFEFFTRHIPETSHPTPESLDIKCETTGASKHRSIYESSRSPIRSDPSVVTTKDKDMRLSSLFLDDMSNGDVDFRLPFKPANFLPATEIDGSEASHALIEYKVHEVDIPKPDFTEIRRSINQPFDDILDPRLRKIFSLRPSESTRFASPEPPSTNKSEPTADFSSKQRIDPRRRNNNETVANETSDILSVATISTPNHLDIQTILQTSDWYKNLSSSYKIMANQQLAHLSGILKKFHLDSTPNKIFDFSIVMQNAVLAQVLTNLGIYIDENGQFVKFTQPNQQSPMQQPQQLGNNMDFGGNNPIGGVNMGMGVDMMNLPVMGMGMVGGVMGPDFNQPQMGPGMLQQQPPGGMGRFMGPAGMPMPLRGPAPNFMSDVRPGLLGVAPGIPYNIFDGQRHGGPNVNPQMFDRNQGSGGVGGGYEHNFQNFDTNENGRFPGRFEPMQPDRRNHMEGDRWPPTRGRNCGNNRSNQNSLRRNVNYDRRTKKN